MPRILVIDDETAVAATIRILLQADKLDVTAADSGEAGLTLLEDGKFDLAIVDIFMPGMDGLKTIQAIRKNAPSIPIIAISGAMPAVAVRYSLDGLMMASQFDAVVCLRKPFRPDELRHAVRSLIATNGRDGKPATAASSAG